MERRFLIQEIEFDTSDPRLITEAELKQRFIMAVNAHLAYNDWPNTLRILLHSEGEQAEPAICKFHSKPPDDEWERWVEKSPFGSCEFEGTTAENWAAIVKQFFREMPRGK